MKEETIVRENLMTIEGYTSYCCNCNTMDRVKWKVMESQFQCNNCGWLSQFPIDFIERYKEKWGK